MEREKAYNFIEKLSTSNEFQNKVDLSFASHHLQ